MSPALSVESAVNGNHKGSEAGSRAMPFYPAFKDQVVIVVGGASGIVSRASTWTNRWLTDFTGPEALHAAGSLSRYCSSGGHESGWCSTDGCHAYQAGRQRYSNTVIQANSQCSHSDITSICARRQHCFG